MRTPRPAVYVVALLLWPLAAVIGSAQLIENNTGFKKQAGGVSDYAGVLRLLEQGVPSKDIARLVKDAGTTFVLSEDQVATLRAKGATGALIAALRKESGIETHSDVTNIGIVLDCSGSMLDRLPDGKSKIDVAKQVVSNFIGRVKDGKNLTFVVYGIEPKKRCDDVHVVQPLAPVTSAMKAKLQAYIEDITPLGFTPLANSMTVVGQQLMRGKGVCMLVVVTDGMETCKGDPSAVAEQLAQNLVLPGGVGVVGLGVPEEERAFFEQQQKKGTFHYFTVDKSEDLGATLKYLEDRSNVAAVNFAKGARANAERAAQAAELAKGFAKRARAVVKLAEPATPLALKAEDAAARASKAAAGAAKAAEDAAGAAKAEALAALATRYADDADEAADEARVAALKAEAMAKAPPQGDEKPPTAVAGQGDLPGTPKIQWDVHILEQNPEHFEVVKRSVKGDEVIWVMQAKSDQAVKFMRAFGDIIGARIAARFLDDEGVQVDKVPLVTSTRDVNKGNNFRISLKLPKDQVLARTAKIAIVFEKTQYWNQGYPEPRKGAVIPPTGGDKTVRPPVEDKAPATTVEAKGSFPGPGRIQWDVHILEANPEHFEVVKRSVKGDEVIWVMQAKSDQAVKFMRAFGDIIGARIAARFLDDEGVQVDKVPLVTSTRDVNKGNNFRISLKLPKDQVLARTAKIAIVFEKTQYWNQGYPEPRKGSGSIQAPRRPQFAECLKEAGPGAGRAEIALAWFSRNGLPAAPPVSATLRERAPQ